MCCIALLILTFTLILSCVTFFSPATVIGNSELKSHIGYQCLSQVKQKSDDTKELMTPSTEAFMCIMCKNLHKKLENIRDSVDGWDTKVKSRKKDGTNADLIDGLFSSQKRGSDPLKAWNRLGINECLQVVKEIKKVRTEKKEAVEAVDWLILDAYREYYEITASSKKTAKAVSKGKISEEEAKIRDEEVEEELDDF